MTSPEPSPRYLEPSQSSGRAFVMRQMTGNVLMLNLLRFRELADYSATPELAPASPISGEAAFQRYIEHTLPYLLESGGRIEFLGKGGEFLIGPPEERWDMAMLIRQQSTDSFLAFASHPLYLAGLGHRAAAVIDSRLLPLSDATTQAREGGPMNHAPANEAIANNAAGTEERGIRLLSRHWEWLDAQPRSASAGLRALVEDARRDRDGRYRSAQTKEACYFYMRDTAGDHPHFEEAVRALFADDRQKLRCQIASWPSHVRARIVDILGLDRPGGVIKGEQ
ncbi:DUF2239 family protein [Dyella sp. 20L07]|uniref:DUF2239 family protein n=1 Tax=Dyella sp. 20L07 TaxID=3384240 RepID=UPI003D2B9028